MAVELSVPKLGLTMEEATLVSWSFQAGAQVAEEEIVLVLETDKVTFEMPAPGSGLLHPLAEPGETIKVSQIVGYLAADQAELDQLAKDAPAAGGAAPAQEAAPAAEKAACAPAKAASSTAPDGRVFASPLAKAMAKEHDIDLSLVPGTGPNGRVVKADIVKALEEGVPAKAEAQAAQPSAPAFAQDDEMALTPAAEIPIAGVRKVVFSNMHASLQTQAQLTLTTEISAEGLIKLRKFFNDRYAKEGVKVSYNALIIKACAQALKAHPVVNASVDGDVIKQWAQVHVGVAMDLGDGLIVPKVRRAEIKGVKAISQAFDSLVEKAKAKQLMPDDLQGGTFTITNLGAWDIDHFTPIVNPPESAILGIGRIAEKPVVKDGEIVVEKRLALSLTIDHRVIDGAPGAAFLKTLKEFLENPLLMLE